jgi:hypothetical protein
LFIFFEGCGQESHSVWGFFQNANSVTKREVRWVESAVCYFLIVHGSENWEVVYWKASNAEVDCVMKWRNNLVGLEVKIKHGKVIGLQKFFK